MNLKTLLVLGLISSCAIAHEDLYQVLGISRKATDKDIKQAFRKLARKYHPDANAERPRWAEKHYVRVNEAHEILSDPEKRKLYDMGGMEMVKNAEKNGGQGGGQNFQGGNMEDILNMFFGGGGGGRRRGGQQGGFGGGGESFFSGGSGFGFGGDPFGGQRQERGRGRQQHYHQQQQEEEVDLKNLKMAVFLEPSNMPNLQDLKEVWNIFYYNDETKNSKEAKWVKNFVEKYGAHLKMCLANCSKHQSLCQDQRIRQVPELYLYHGKGQKIKINLVKNLPLEFLVQENINFMEKKVEKVTISNFAEFSKRNLSKPVILSFTERRSTGILLLSIALLLKDQVVFGEISKGDPLCQKFKVSSFPKIISLEDPINFKATEFTGGATRNEILYWIQKTAMVKRQVGVREFNKEQMKQGSCGVTDNDYCFISVVKSTSTQRAHESLLESLNDDFSSDGINFYFVHQNQIKTSEWQQSFAEAQMFIVRGKRKRYMALEGGLLDTSLDQVKSSLENLLSGGGRMKNYRSIEALLV